MKCLILDTIEAFRSKWRGERGMERVVTPNTDAGLFETYDGFVKEELGEIFDALALDDQTEREVGVADGLCDAFVFLATLTARSGFQYVMPYLYAEVARSNSTKGGPSGLFTEAGKMIKGENYRPPDLRKFWTNSLIILDTPISEAFTRELCKSDKVIVTAGVRPHVVGPHVFFVVAEAWHNFVIRTGNTGSLFSVISLKPTNETTP